MRYFSVFTSGSVFVVSVLIPYFVLFSGCGSKTQNRLSKEAPLSTVLANNHKVKSQFIIGENGAVLLDLTLPSCFGSDCCYQDKDCIKKCENLSSESEGTKKCLELPVDWVTQMDELLNQTLTRPSRENLENIELRALWSIIKINEKSWLNKVNDYSRVQAWTVLFYIASQPDISRSIFSVHTSFARSLLIALFRKNTRSPLVDNNALLSGMKASISEEGTFFKIAKKQKNSKVISLVHEQVIKRQLCDYQINQPQPAVAGSGDSAYEACVLAVYCHLTGSYSSGQYSDDGGRNAGQELRKQLASEVNDKEIENFIQSPLEKGGLGIEWNADDWTDAACVKLTELWDDRNLKFGL